MKWGTVCRCIAAILMAQVRPELAFAQGDPGRGATLFRACAACHSITAGENLTGPSLAKIWERKAGTIEGFPRYSDAIKHADVTWNESALDKWLAGPDAFIPGTSMTFPGLRESNARRDVIAYLKAVSQRRPVAETLQRGDTMRMRPSKVDLKKAPLQGQVTAISYCGDTYTVKTADGKVNKVWEFNLRFKTDSSALGPQPAKPVIVGAGMQGDRASIVFAAPNEIGTFVRRECAETK